jgi:hypothetical protein
MGFRAALLLLREARYPKSRSFRHFGLKRLIVCERLQGLRTGNRQL